MMHMCCGTHKRHVAGCVAGNKCVMCEKKHMHIRTYVLEYMHLRVI